MKLTFVLFLFFFALTLNVFATSNDPNDIIQIDPDLTSWKIKGPGFLSKWEVGRAKINPENTKMLLATAHDNQQMEHSHHPFGKPITQY